MVTAAVVFTQGLNFAAAGVALIGVVGTELVTTNGNDAGVVTWKFELVDVSSLSALTSGVKQVGSTPSYTFLPDAPGGYLMHLTTFDTFGNFAEDFRVFQIAETSGRIIVPFKGTDKSLNFIIGGVMNLRGWAPFMEAYLRYVDSLSVAGVIHVTANFVQPAVGGTVTVHTTSTALLGPGLGVFIVGAGYFSVVSVTNATDVVLTNLGTNGNVAPTTTILSGALLVPTGLPASGPSPAPTTVLSSNTALAATDTWVLFIAGPFTLTAPVAPIPGQLYEMTHTGGGTLTGAKQVTLASGAAYTITDPQNPTGTPASSVKFLTDAVTYRFRLDGLGVFRCVN